MTSYGGMGGVTGGRPRNTADAFEEAIEKAFGEQLRAENAAPGACDGGFYRDDSLGCRIWGSLANVDWIHENGDTAGYSFRAAGDLIAAIIGSGDYMDWYCSADDGYARDEIIQGLAKYGWRPA